MNIPAQPQVQCIWLFGSRAMGREQPGSDLDLCLPWQVDLVLRHELPAELEEHVQRVGRCLWTQP